MKVKTRRNTSAKSRCTHRVQFSSTYAIYNSFSDWAGGEWGWRWGGVGSAWGTVAAETYQSFLLEAILSSSGRDGMFSLWRHPSSCSSGDHGVAHRVIILHKQHGDVLMHGDVSTLTHTMMYWHMVTRMTRWGTCGKVMCDRHHIFTKWSNDELICVWQGGYVT